MSEMEVPEPPAPVPEPEPEAPPEWSGPSRDEWEQAQAQLAQYQQILQPQQPQYQEQQAVPAPDPWAENYQEQLEAWAEAKFAPKLAFVEQLEQEMVQQQGREAALVFLEKDSASNGALTDPGRVWDQANYLVGTGQVPKPQNDREANQLLTDLARQQREYDKKVGEAYHQQQLEQMQTVAGGQRRLPPGPQGAQTVSAGGYGNVPYAVANRFFGGDKS